jgi:hypothetical protein
MNKADYVKPVFPNGSAAGKIKHVAQFVCIFILLQMCIM